jgi:hypothetical protein
MDKSIVIECPIGRIKWLKAPEDCGEVYYYLCKTLNQDLDQVELYTENKRLVKERQGYLDALRMAEDVLRLSAVPTGVVKPEPVYTRSANTEVGNTRSAGNEVVKEAMAFQLTGKAIETVKSKQSRVNRRVQSKGKTEQLDPKLQAALNELKSMGFDDERSMRLAIVQANYNVETAVELLVTGQVQ